ncbi:hypothetical protein JHW43_002013 [Diplocarpon mali]|nr:hypothetical protein JHW43_002013 [Diplocarpon mali]
MFFCVFLHPASHLAQHPQQPRLSASRLPSCTICHTDAGVIETSPTLHPLNRVNRVRFKVATTMDSNFSTALTAALENLTLADDASVGSDTTSSVNDDFNDRSADVRDSRLASAILALDEDIPESVDDSIKALIQHHTAATTVYLSSEGHLSKDVRRAPAKQLPRSSRSRPKCYNDIDTGYLVELRAQQAAKRALEKPLPRSSRSRSPRDVEVTIDHQSSANRPVVPLTAPQYRPELLEQTRSPQEEVQNGKAPWSPHRPDADSALVDGRLRWHGIQIAFRPVSIPTTEAAHHVAAGRPAPHRLELRPQQPVPGTTASGCRTPETRLRRRPGFPTPARRIGRVRRGGTGKTPPARLRLLPAPLEEGAPEPSRAPAPSGRRVPVSTPARALPLFQPRRRPSCSTPPLQARP